MIIKLKDLLPRRLLEADCKPGETNAKTGCTPEDGGGSSKSDSGESADDDELPNDDIYLAKSVHKMSEKERSEELNKHQKELKKTGPAVAEHEKIQTEYRKDRNALYAAAEAAGEDSKEPPWKAKFDKLIAEKRAAQEHLESAVERDWIIRDRVDKLKYQNPPNKRKSEMKKRQGGGKVEILSDEGYNNYAYNEHNQYLQEDRGAIEDALDKGYKDNNPLAKMTSKEKAIAYDHLATWKYQGGYDPDQQIEDEYQAERQKYMTKLANNTMQTPPPKQISRGMRFDAGHPDIKKLVEQYSTVGKSVNMDFTQGFTSTREESQSYAMVSGEGDVGFHITIKPNSSGQLRGVHIDGVTNDPDYLSYASDGKSKGTDKMEKDLYESMAGYKGEQEFVRSSESSATVVEFIEQRGKAPKGHPDYPREIIFYEIVLQEPDDLNEGLVREGRHNKSPYYSPNTSPKRMANVIEKRVIGHGVVYYAQPQEGARKIRLYSDKKLKKIKDLVNVRDIYGKPKYTKQLSKREQDKFLGKTRVADRIGS